MIVWAQFVLLRVFLDADAGTNKKENDQRLCEKIDNACQQHKRGVSGLEDGEVQKALGEADCEQNKGRQA